MISQNDIIAPSIATFPRGCTRRFDWIGWSPLAVLPTLTIAFCNRWAPWVFMWTICFALYFSCKWLTWWQAKNSVHVSRRDFAYLFVWPGMDAEEFLNCGDRAPKPASAAWLFAVLNTLFGVVLLWGLTPAIPDNHALLKGWIGMAGVILILHFGSFQSLAMFWQSRGINARPLMQSPGAAKSLAEFWGRRWNSAFNRIAHDLLFRSLCQRLGVRAATLLAFAVSGLVHDLVISVPARGGYGLPTSYFLVQGAGLLVERSRTGRRLGFGRGRRGRAFTIFVAAAPVFWLFSPTFVKNVILPMLHAFGAT
jgi:Membrane bound O-acyl transferase family